MSNSFTSPPKESIGGNKKHHLQALERGISTYAELVKMNDFKNSGDFRNLDITEQNALESEFQKYLVAYEENQAIVAEY